MFMQYSTWDIDRIRTEERAAASSKEQAAIFRFLQGKKFPITTKDFGLYMAEIASGEHRKP